MEPTGNREGDSFADHLVMGKSKRKLLRGLVGLVLISIIMVGIVAGIQFFLLRPVHHHHQPVSIPEEFEQIKGQLEINAHPIWKAIVNSEIELGDSADKLLRIAEPTCTITYRSMVIYDESNLKDRIRIRTGSFPIDEFQMYYFYNLPVDEVRKSIEAARARETYPALVVIQVLAREGELIVARAIATDDNPDLPQRDCFFFVDSKYGHYFTDLDVSGVPDIQWQDGATLPTPR